MADYSASMLDHLNLGVSDIETIAPLLHGGARRHRDRRAARLRSRRYRFGHQDNRLRRGTKPFFWLVDGQRVGENTHVAFAVDSRDGVHAFYEAALAAGGTDNGAPGLRPEYHDDYYGAFVLDPDEVNVEAVYHGT